MKILYAIQGTGNGHLSRARDIIPLLQQHGELDILISGIQADVELPYPVKYRFNGLSFIFGKSGGVDFIATFRKSNLKKLLREIKSLPVQDYDLVINDFEPVSAWACKRIHKECIGLSHQAAVINSNSPKPKVKDTIGKAILQNYAPVTRSYGFHFEAYDRHISTPVIRGQIRDAYPQNRDHFTVYLPAYNDERIIQTLSLISGVSWKVFSKNSQKEYSVENVHISPIDNDRFIDSLVNCTGILCGAGFETPAEALFLKKKLLVIPMKGQYEQQCNAAALKAIGVTVVKSLKKKNAEKIRLWTESELVIPVNYPDVTAGIIQEIIDYNNKPVSGSMPGKSSFSVRKFKKVSLDVLLDQKAPD